MKLNAAIKQDPLARRPARDGAVRKLYGLVLDCDGVLFDSKAANTAYYNHIRYAVHLPPMSEEEADYSHMASTEEALQRMIPDELKESAARVREMTRYRDTFMPMMQPAAHMTTFLRHMRDAGLPLALCTNRSDSVHDVLRHFDIEQFFSPVVTITHVQPKPSPDGLLEVVRAWDVDPASIAFLGDSLVDQQAAVAAGVPFWSYNNSQLAAKIHVSDFIELDEILSLMLM